MIFEKIANGITRHYKMVIVIWVVALLISVPAILQVNEAVSYETSFGGADKYESTRANDIIARDFRTSVANGTLIVLIQADDVTDPEVRDFVLRLEERVSNSSEMQYLQGTTSVYTYATTVLQQVIMQLGPHMRPAEENITFGAFLIWGVPSVHAQFYTDYGSDAAAYSATHAALEMALADADNATKALAFGYYDAFAGTWNATSMITDPEARASNAVNLTAPAFIANIPDEHAEVRALLGAVFQGFDISNYDDVSISHALMLQMVGGMASITNLTFLQEMYELGPTYTNVSAYAYADSIVRTGTLATYPYALPEQLVTSFVSANNRSMLVMLAFTVGPEYRDDKGQSPLSQDVTALRGIISSVKAEQGITATTYVTGDAAISADMEASSTSDLEKIEPITIIIIVVLMGYLFRSVVGQFLPLGAVGVAIGISQALVFVIGTTIGQINYTVTTMLFAILMGVGTDYSIFIITRYREERIRGADREQAVRTSVAWAGESIVTSGATVIIAFFAMALSSFTFVQTMGLLLGLAIVVALLVSLTLIPAILMVVGNRIFWPTTGKRFERFAHRLMQRKREGNHGYFHRAATFSVKHAKVVVITAILISIPTTYIYATTETGFDFIGSMGKSESVDGLTAMTDDFGAGLIMPTYVVVTGETVVYQNGSFNYAYLDALDNVTATVADDSQVRKVSSVTRPYGTWIDYRNLSALSAEEQVAIRDAMLTFVGGSDNTTVMMTVVLKDQPQEAAVVDYMPTMREKLAAAKASQDALAGSEILLGGSTAALYDMGTDTTHQFTNIEIVVIIGIFIVLMIVLGSLLLPAFAVVSIAMSITWAFAATTLVFGTWLGKPILWIIPLILFVMLMGIGMDYNVFILTRIREEAHKGKPLKQAVVDAVDWTGGIITALALIMAGAFGSLMLSSNAMLQQFGFALLLAVLLDAMVVRTYIVPAAITLMGKWAWWAPGPLQRVGREEKKGDKDAQ